MLGCVGISVRFPYAPTLGPIGSLYEEINDVKGDDAARFHRQIVHVASHN